MCTQVLRMCTQELLRMCIQLHFVRVPLRWTPLYLFQKHQQNVHMTKILRKRIYDPLGIQWNLYESRTRYVWNQRSRLEELSKDLKVSLQWTPVNVIISSTCIGPIKRWISEIQCLSP